MILVDDIKLEPKYLAVELDGVVVSGIQLTRDRWMCLDEMDCDWIALDDDIATERTDRNQQGTRPRHEPNVWAICFTMMDVSDAEPRHGNFWVHPRLLYIPPVTPNPNGRVVRDFDGEEVLTIKGVNEAEFETLAVVCGVPLVRLIVHDDFTAEIDYPTKRELWTPEQHVVTPEQHRRGS